MPPARLPLWLLLCRNSWCLTAICCQLRATQTCSSGFFLGVGLFFFIGVYSREDINTCRVKISEVNGKRSELNWSLIIRDSRDVLWMDGPERGRDRQQTQKILKVEWELLPTLAMTTIPINVKWQNLHEIKNVHLSQFLPP